MLYIFIKFIFIILFKISLRFVSLYTYGARLKSSLYDLRMLGYTRVTKVKTKSCKNVN